MKKLLKPVEPVLDKGLDTVESFIHTHPKVNFLFGALLGHLMAFSGVLRKQRILSHLSGTTTT